MQSSPTEQRDFIAYPINRVVGTVADAKTASAAIDALLRAGFSRDDIDILHGEAGEQRLDPEGTEHGFLAQFQRTLIRTAGPAEEHKYLMHHVDDVRAGRFVIMVLAKERDERTIAADILNAHGAEFVGFYGRWAWEGFSSELHSSAGPGSSQTIDAVARRPEDIPSLFGRAWNARDAVALASLFDENAEFVNVTGLWWHDRDSIRRAHAYGLERIFNDSTLSIIQTRIRRLSDDVAILLARMRLSGQTPLGNIRKPGTRTTIFTFVVYRVGDRWQCASAHNTDVVPEMETNIIGDDGAFRAANYRTGHVTD